MLSSHQSSLLKRCADRWAEWSLSTGPCDRPAAERGVELAYASAEFVPPHVVWCQSPAELARFLQAATERAVMSELLGTVTKSGLAVAEANLGGRHLAKLRRELGSDPRYAPVRSICEYSLAQAVATNGATGLIGRLLAFCSQRFVSKDMSELLSDGGITANDCSDLVICEVFDRSLDRRGLEALRLVGENAGAVVACEHTCWLVERPVLLRTDARFQLHCADGPAVVYPDGWTAYAWKGVRVPPWMIEEKDRLTPAAIAAQASPRLRRCMIEILTPERYVKTGDPSCVAQDDTGVLWRKWWPPSDIWLAVEVVNGTPNADGSYSRYVLQVPPDLRTAREAVAWTYGMSGRAYRGLRQRT